MIGPRPVNRYMMPTISSAVTPTGRVAVGAEVDVITGVSDGVNVGPGVLLGTGVSDAVGVLDAVEVLDGVDVGPGVGVKASPDKPIASTDTMQTSLQIISNVSYT
jgi:UDP-3-O-[3-hydroxymyristoyl] glucosamine N-acyltransferase